MSGSLFESKGVLAKGEAPVGDPPSIVIDVFPQLVKGIHKPLRSVFPPHTFYDYTTDTGLTYTGTEKGVHWDVVFVEIKNPSYAPIYVANKDFLIGPTSAELANQAFKGRLVSCRIGKSAVNAIQAGGVVGISSSELTIANDDNFYDSLIEDQRYINAAVRIWGITCHPCYPNLNIVDNALQLFEGTVLSMTKTGRRISFTLGDVLESVSKDFVTTKYDGTAAQGGTSLKDTPMPVCLGLVSNITPVYLGQIDLGNGPLPTFHVNYTSIQDITAVRVRGATMTKVGGTPVVGQYKVFASEGKFQLGSTPSGIVTCDVQGHNAGTYGYATEMPNIIRKMMVSVSGAFVADDLPDINFATLFNFPGATGLYIPPEKGMTLIDALNYYCAGTGCLIHGLRNGEVSGTLLDVNTPPVLDLEDYDILTYSKLALPSAYLPRPDKIEFTYNINYTPMTDIAESITGDTRTYLEGTGRNSSVVPAILTLKPRTLKTTWHFAALSATETRVNSLKAWYENNPQFISVVTNRYLGQVELGMTCLVNLSQAGIVGRNMKIVEYEEDLTQGRLVLKLLG